MVPNSLGDDGRSTLGEITKRASMPAQRCRALLEIARNAPPGDALELGSNVGLSGAYLATALQRRGRGCLVTVEGIAELAEAARRTAAIVGVEDTMEVVCSTFDDVIQDAGERRYAFVLLDGEHVPEPTVRYAEALRELLLPRGVMVIDDCSRATGMAEAFAEISAWDCWQRSWTDGRFGVLRLRG